MFRMLLATLVATTTCSVAYANQAASHEHAAHAAHAIANPLRPGAKAPTCEAQQETADGCTFHSVAGDTYDAYLLAAPGESWVAHVSNAAEVSTEAARQAPAVDGKTYQLIKVLPNPQQDADATVTFDKLTGKPGAEKVIERRRITVMIHPS